MRIRQAVILAGGMGTRLKPLTDNLPKPMILMNGKPFLEYLLAMLKDNGIEEVLLLLGFMPEKIMDYFGDGSRFGLKIKYSVSDVDFDTGKRLRLAEELVDDNFLLMYCDNYHPFNLKKRIEHHMRYAQKSVLVTVNVYTNKDNFTKNNIRVDGEGYVTLYDRARLEPNLSGVEIGFFIVNKKVFEFMPNNNFSFQSTILPILIEKRKLAAYLTDHRYYSIGSLERLPVTEKFLKPRKIVFLDRDGVINKKAPKADYVKKWEEFVFLPGAIDAMKALSKNSYEIYIISNQAGIARRMMSLDDLNDIHYKMLKELAKHGVTINGIYFCPHGWDENCDCRKPKPGMFYQAAREHAINLTRSIFVGDDERDAQTGEAAGIRTILVSPKKGLAEAIDSLIKG